MSHRCCPARVAAQVVSVRSLSRSLLAIACAWPLLAAAQSVSQEAVDLDRLKVEGHRGDATEGSDSYTADLARSSAKLALSLRETPQSVVVISQQQIVDRDLQTFQDVTDAVAGFNSPTWDTERTYISARGFEIDYYRVDGIPTQYTGDVQQNLAIYDRVEIVRGANGLTTGAGSPAASIDLVRKHADSDVFTGNASLSAGSWDRYRGTVDVQSPLNAAGNVRGRVVASYEDKDSFRDYYSKTSGLLYGIVDADFSDATHGYAGVSKQRNDGRGTTWGGVPAWFSDGTRTHFSRSDSFTPRWARGVADTTNAFAGLIHRFEGGAQLHVEYSHQRFETDWKSVLYGYYGYPDRVTGLGLDSIYGGDYPTSTRQDSLDAYVRLPLTWWGREHEIVAGATWTDRNARSWYNLPLQPLVAESVYAWTGTMPQPAWTPLQKGSENDVRQVGAYAAGRFNLTDNLKAIVGARVSDWKNTDRLAPASSYAKRGRTTPYAGLIYDLDAHHSLYASYTSIFNPQNNRDRNGRYLEPLEGNNCEIGAKGEYFGGRLNAGLTLFRIEQDNFAVADPGQTGAGHHRSGLSRRRRHGQPGRGGPARWRAVRAVAHQLRLGAVRRRRCARQGRQPDQPTPRGHRVHHLADRPLADWRWVQLAVVVLRARCRSAGQHAAAGAGQRAAGQPDGPLRHQPGAVGAAQRAQSVRPALLRERHLSDPVDLRRPARCGADPVLAVLSGRHRVRPSPSAWTGLARAARPGRLNRGAGPRSASC